MNKYQLIDWEAKGKLVRFYYGDIDNNDYGGDDWNDAPYEHNAGKVYDRFIKGYQDICFPFNSVVLEPCDGVYNSVWSKDAMKAKKVPCIVVKDLKDDEYGWEYNFLELCAAKEDESIHKFYFGDIALEDKITLIGDKNI